jgi:ABC-2 type transport system permease protein
VKLNVGIVSEKSADVADLSEKINKNSLFKSSIIDQNNIDLKELIYTKNFDFIIKIPQNYKTQINKNQKDFGIEIYSKPDISNQNYQILKNTFTQSIFKQIMGDYFAKNKINAKTLISLNDKISNSHIYKNDRLQTQPNSVQQSVPAWLVFSMFFILIPISNIFISEKSLGTFKRIRSMNVSLIPILFGKIIPYFCINQIQAFLMILVGIFAVPLFGGDKLIINGNYFLIFIMSSAISLAAICFALFIASISKTTQEATSIGGVSNIILAALGGIMVPKFVMPEFMHNLTNYSPMSWGLEGFLEIFVRGGSFIDISHYVFYLIIFALSFLILTYFLLTKNLK